MGNHPDGWQIDQRTMWTFHPCWYSEPNWTVITWATCFSWPCFEQTVWIRWSLEVHFNLGCPIINPIKITDTFKIQKIVLQTLNLIVQVVGVEAFLVAGKLLFICFSSWYVSLVECFGYRERCKKMGSLCSVFLPSLFANWPHLSKDAF